LSGGEPGSRPTLSITFDDGYRDNVIEALPILMSEECRATLYVTAEAVSDALPPWPHRLATDLLSLVQDGNRGGTPIGSVSLNNYLRKYFARSKRSAKGRHLQTLEFVDSVKRLPDAEREEICAQVARLAGTPRTGAAPMVGPQDLELWCRSGMELGSHSSTHRILSRTERRTRKEDVTDSRLRLEHAAGRPVLHFAYPNGRPGDWNEECKEDLREAGYESAVTTLEGLNGPRLDRFEIRRINVGNDDIPVLATRVSGLLASLRLRIADADRRRAQRSGALAPGASGATLRETSGLRIAFIGGRGVGGAYSGIERYYEEVGSRLASRGHRVTAYCRAHFTPDTPRYRGIEIRRLPTLHSKHLETLVHSLLATLDVCFRRVDVVQFHALGSSPFALIPRLLGMRSVVSVRGLDWRRAKWGHLARAYLRFCEVTSLRCPTATVVVSRTLQHYFQERFGRRVHYIPNGVSRFERLPGDNLRHWGLEPRCYFLYAGRISPEKGLETLIEAHRGLGPSCALVLAGGSSYSRAYMDRLKATAPPNTLFPGFLSGPILHELYSNALAFVLPSEMEGMSVALLEAMAHGLPVIASDIPENRELVQECGGKLFQLNDVASLAEALQHVLNHPEATLLEGARTSESVRGRFDWERITDETETFYYGLLRGRAESVPDPHTGERAA
jgi:glycosyltransferase involved in cell wall biosynthesis/peptidoglycan/xylan/chitin deacetylase (PgdA/CDA1 family)